MRYAKYNQKAGTLYDVEEIEELLKDDNKEEQKIFKNDTYVACYHKHKTKERDWFAFDGYEAPKADIVT